ncbi:ribose-phosphate pyrophosphokinase [Bdellovibrio sp. SKB1291214]|uniref:ribose-phosphate diphosphokinase n=1 Tax=Bdellovibrio sp. SKB1291214 TaxID=1732569 RepID=UPI000B5175C9|nr:ribose-phosphate pyrophosphokinase [Bdellovibrio sp. SKB1291214]UYL09481.1 ribose-phosphate pyrophosphokinase [Bdellovibrio sp. SKB1291214]
MKGLKVFTANSNPELAKKVAAAAGIELGFSEVSTFADGEIQVEIHESVRGQNVFVIQSTCPPVNQSYMELFVMLDALRRASAASITAVIPYFGYARQDRKVAPRAPISAKLMADLIVSAGATRVVCVDLHAAQIQGFFNIPVDHLFAIPTLARAWRESHGIGPDFVAVSPDAGGVERTRAFAKRIESSMAIIDKRRSGPNEAKALHLIGDVTGKTAVIVDDMIDTAGTLTQAVDSLYKNGAKRVFAVATHPVLSGPAIARLKDSPIEKVWVTDTIPLSEAAKTCGKIEVVSVAPVLAEAIKRIHGNDSVSSLFD